MDEWEAVVPNCEGAKKSFLSDVHFSLASCCRHCASMGFFSSGAAGGDVNPRQRPQPGLPQLTGSRVQTRPQGHHDSDVHPLQPDEGEKGWSPPNVSTLAWDSSPHPASSSSSCCYRFTWWWQWWVGSSRSGSQLSPICLIPSSGTRRTPTASESTACPKLSVGFSSLFRRKITLILILLAKLNHLHCWNQEPSVGPTTAAFDSRLKLTF